MFTKPVPVPKPPPLYETSASPQNRHHFTKPVSVSQNRRHFTKPVPVPKPLPLYETSASPQNRRHFTKQTPVSKTHCPSPKHPLSKPIITKHSPQPDAASSFLSACWNFPSCQKEKIPPVPRWPPSLKCPDFPKEHWQKRIFPLPVDSKNAK